MEIEAGVEYRINGKSKYFRQKYGTSNPIVKIEAIDHVVFGMDWFKCTGNPACMLYGMRVGLDGLPNEGKVYYGKVMGFGELVNEIELEEKTWVEN